MIPIKNNSYITKPFELLQYRLIERFVPVSEKLESVSDKIIVKQKSKQKAKSRFDAITVQRVRLIPLEDMNYRIMDI